MQRGRDHGLPPYNEWRQVCGYEKAKTWKDLEEYMDAQVLLLKCCKIVDAHKNPLVCFLIKTLFFKYFIFFHFKV